MLSCPIASNSEYLQILKALAEDLMVLFEGAATIGCRSTAINRSLYKGDVEPPFPGSIR